MGKRLDRYEERVLVDMKGNKHLQGPGRVNSFLLLKPVAEQTLSWQQNTRNDWGKRCEFPISLHFPGEKDYRLFYV